MRGCTGAKGDDGAVSVVYVGGEGTDVAGEGELAPKDIEGTYGGRHTEQVDAHITVDVDGYGLHYAGWWYRDGMVDVWRV